MRKTVRLLDGKKLFVLSTIVFLFLFSCQTASLIVHPFPTVEASKQIKDFSIGTSFTHIRLNCAILDFDLNVLTYLSRFGICNFEQNGHSVVWRHGSLVAQNQNLKVIWRKEHLGIHHVIEKSIFNDDILTINSIIRKNPKYGQLRYDELLIFSRQGKLLKSFDFSNYFEKNPKAIEYLPKLNVWTKDNLVNQTYELNHGNSFSELYSEKNGQRVLIGYAFTCIAQHKIYIFDTDLKNIVNELPFTRSLHTVRQYDENHLVAYQNASFVGDMSSIQLISLKDGSFKTLYESKNPELAAVACSSVQVLPGDKLFIVHSRCLLQPEHKDAKGYYLEFVDLKNKKSTAVFIDSVFAQQAGELINAKEYLKNSIGQ